MIDRTTSCLYFVFKRWWTAQLPIYGICLSHGLNHFLFMTSIYKWWIKPLPVWILYLWVMDWTTSCLYAVFVGDGLSRDVYCIESIVLYQYHKTDTSILSKWQINDTFNDTFYDDINKNRASLTQKWMIIFIKYMFCFSFLHYLENYGPWVLLYCMLSIPKGQMKKVNFLMVWYRIVSYRIGILLSVSVLYCIVKKIKGTHP